MSEFLERAEDKSFARRSYQIALATARRAEYRYRVGHTDVAYRAYGVASRWKRRRDYHSLPHLCRHGK